MATKREPEAYERLLSCLKESNQEWAKQAPVLLLTVAKKHFAQGDALNRYAWHDVGMATANLVLQALALGIYAHPMAGIYPDRAQAELGIPESYEPVTAIALGYRGELSTLPERRREAEQRPRTRRPLTEMVFIGRWGKAAAFLEASDDRHW